MVLHFRTKEIFSELSKDEVKSNKRAVRRAIDDDTYKKLLESGELTESELEVVAKSVDVTIPKKVYSVENVKAKEMKEKFQKLLAGLPIISQEKLNELIESIKIDFKPLEEELFIEEKAKYTEKFQDLVSKDKVYVATLDGTFQIWRELFSYDKVQYEKIKTGRYRRNPYTKQEEEVLEEQAYVTNLKFKLDWETTFDKFLKEYISTLKYSFINAIINNFDRITKPIVDFVKLRIIRGYKGFEGVYRFIFDDGSYFDFKAEAIRAGGYNIQILHLRYITNFENITLNDGTKVKGYSNLIENFNVKTMEKGGLNENDMKNKTDKYKGMLKKPSSLLKISQMHKVPMFFLQSQLIKGMKVESEHTNREVVAKIIALHHLEEDPSYYIKLEKVESKMNDGGLVYKKIYNRAGGGYTTIINGMLYNINKQYNKGTWVAQSDDGEYYKETQTLAELKDYLKHLNKKNKMAKGGKIDPDNKLIKSAMTHKAGSAGGLLVGNRHSEGGIKAINKSTNTPILLSSVFTSS
jgi:hypothetical protein